MPHPASVSAASITASSGSNRGTRAPWLMTVSWMWRCRALSLASNRDSSLLGGSLGEGYVPALTAVVRTRRPGPLPQREGCSFPLTAGRPPGRWSTRMGRGCPLCDPLPTPSRLLPGPASPPFQPSASRIAALSGRAWANAFIPRTTPPDNACRPWHCRTPGSRYGGTVRHPRPDEPPRGVSPAASGLFRGMPIAPLAATLAVQTLATAALFSLPAIAPAVAASLHVNGELVGGFRRDRLRHRDRFRAAVARPDPPLWRRARHAGGAAGRRRHGADRRHRPSGVAGAGGGGAGAGLWRRRPGQHAPAGAADAAVGVQHGHVAAADRRAVGRRARGADPAAAGARGRLAARAADRTGAAIVAAGADGAVRAGAGTPGGSRRPSGASAAPCWQPFALLRDRAHPPPVGRQFRLFRHAALLRGIHDGAT